MDLNRVFYANTVGLVVRGDEAALIFSLRKLEDVVAAEEKAKQEDKPALEITGSETVRVHIPKSLLDELMTQTADGYRQQMNAAATASAETKNDGTAS